MIKKTVAKLEFWVKIIGSKIKLNFKKYQILISENIKFIFG